MKALEKQRQLQLQEQDQQQQRQDSFGEVGPQHQHGRMQRVNSSSRELHVHVHLQTPPTTAVGTTGQPSIQTTTTSLPIPTSISSASLTTTTTTTTSTANNSGGGSGGSNDMTNNRKCSSTCLLLAVLCCYVIMRDIAFGINASSTNEFYLRNFDKFHFPSTRSVANDRSDIAVEATDVDQQDNRQRYNILCTATDKVTTWGSYIIRCKDLKVWADRCAPNVNIDLLSRETLRNIINPPTKDRKKRRRFSLRSIFSFTTMLSLRSSSSSGTSSNDIATTAQANGMQTLPLAPLNSRNKYVYNATVSIKNALNIPVNNSKISFGKLFVDVVDNYKLVADNITLNVDVIVQNQYHAMDIFPNHTYHIIEHWYNSFPLDMMNEGETKPISFEIPQIRNISYGGVGKAKHSRITGIVNFAQRQQVSTHQESTEQSYSFLNSVMSMFTTTKQKQQAPVHRRDMSKLLMGTVWTNQGYPCPSLANSTTTNNAHVLNELLDISYNCIDRNYLISTWYDELPFISPNDKLLAKSILENSTLLGPGRLYYELFWKFDVLVIPVKRQSQLPKLRYGNVQRAVSQMRSGVPVLLELGGEVLDEFMDRYNYTCVFVTNQTATSSSTNVTAAALLSIVPNSNTDRKYWTFDEASIAMKDPNLRRQCQLEGLAIVKDYSPSQIAQKHLRALGYQDEFVC